MKTLKFMLAVALCSATATSDDLPDPVESLRDPAESLHDPAEALLLTMALSRSDLAISKDYLPDPDRMPITRDFLRNPLSAESRSTEICQGLAQAEGVQVVRSAANLVKSDGVHSQHEEFEPDLDYTDFFRAGNKRLALLPGAAVDSRRLLDLVHPDTSLSAPAQDALLEVGRRVDVGGLMRLSASLLKWAIARLDLPIEEAATFRTPFGRIAIGSTGDDVYEGPHALIVDPGGNDRYLGCAGAAIGLSISIAIDFSGNDVYLGACAVGERGIGILIDAAGNDQYVGGELTQGAGAGGVGVLVDLNGDDSYESTFGGQAFGLYGAGILIDQAGTDTYRSELLAQGTAGPGGVGVLVDREGHDVYHAGGRYKDFREDGVYARSMSQGFSYGIQTEASGGVGILVDLAGHDRYEADYFAQGASFWAGTGILYDGEGSDVYSARRYAQGCGLHFSAGILVDRSGNDVYSLWGVGQGGGHDLGLGVLSDYAGNDQYDVSWMGQGVGSGNGRGFLVDHGGNDIYSARQENTQGYGEGARGFGSIGLLLDAAGENRFERAGAGILRSGNVGGRYDVMSGVAP